MAESSPEGLVTAGAGSPRRGGSNHCPSLWILPLTLSNLADGQGLSAGVGVGAQERGCGVVAGIWGLPSAVLALGQGRGVAWPVPAQAVCSVVRASGEEAWQ